MAWPWIPEPRCGYAGTARRYIPARTVGLRGGTDIHPPRGNPNRCDPGSFFFLRKCDGIITWAVPYESDNKSHRLFWTRCPVWWITHHSLFPLSDASFPLLARLTPPSPTVAPLLAYRLRCCCCQDTTPQKACRRSTASLPCYLSLLERPWVQLRLVSRKPHGVALGPLAFAFAQLGRYPGAARSPPATLPSPSHVNQTIGGGDR
jgi:hypothetical protein